MIKKILPMVTTNSMATSSSVGARSWAIPHWTTSFLVMRRAFLGDLPEVSGPNIRSFHDISDLAFWKAAW
jgi:hypothetical protein